MINTYYRPKSLEDALALLMDPARDLRPMGGGTQLSRVQKEGFGVVDLQDIGLDHITKRGQRSGSGAGVRLDELLDQPEVHPEIKRAIRIDVS